MQHSHANGLVIRKAIFGEGAERVVFAMREAHFGGTVLHRGPKPQVDPLLMLLGAEMVAKESRFVEDLCSSGFVSAQGFHSAQLSRASFHKHFCKTQVALARSSQLPFLSCPSSDCWMRVRAIGASRS